MSQQTLPCTPPPKKKLSRVGSFISSDLPFLGWNAKKLLNVCSNHAAEHSLLYNASNSFSFSVFKCYANLKVPTEGNMHVILEVCEMLFKTYCCNLYCAPFYFFLYWYVSLLVKFNAMSWWFWLLYLCQWYTIYIFYYLSDPTNAIEKQLKNLDNSNTS